MPTPSLSDILRHLERLAPSLDLNPGSNARRLAETAYAQGDKLFHEALREFPRTQPYRSWNTYETQIRKDSLGLPHIWGPTQVSRIFKPSWTPVEHTNKPSWRDDLVATTKEDLRNTVLGVPMIDSNGDMYSQLKANALRQIQEHEDQHIFQILGRVAKEGFGPPSPIPTVNSGYQTLPLPDYQLMMFPWVSEGGYQRANTSEPYFRQEIMGQFLEEQAPPTNGWLMYEQPGTYDVNPRALEKLGVTMPEFEFRTTPATFTSEDFQRRPYPYLPPSPPPPSKPMTLSEMSQKALRLRLTAWDLIGQTQDDGAVFRPPTQWEVLTSTETPVAPEDSRPTAWQKLLEDLE